MSNLYIIPQNPFSRKIKTRYGVGVNEEKKLWKNGYKFVVGLDEVGRGPLAGPVVAAAVMLNPKFKIINSKQIINSKKQVTNKFRISSLGFRVSEIKDSKQLSEKKREELYKVLTNHPAISWGIGIVSEKIIDKINILEATKLAMQKAIDNLKISPNFILIDGNFSLKSKIPQKSIIKGDEKVFSITVAGIIAKVTRDRLMKKMDKKYPEYGFKSHKGYGTDLHIRNLKKFGLSKIHRKTFEPVKSIAKR